MLNHGTISAYNNGSCRCDPCRAAFSRTWKARSESYRGLPPDHCEICKRSEKLFWDHDHSTESHRGWLCRGCNSFIGYFKESPEILERAARYLEGTL